MLGGFGAVLLCAILCGELLKHAERPGGSTGFDSSITAWMVAHRSSAWTALARGLSTVGSQVVLTPVTVAVAAVLLRATATGSGGVTRRRVGRSDPSLQPDEGFRSAAAPTVGHLADERGQDHFIPVRACDTIAGHVRGAGAGRGSLYIEGGVAWTGAGGRPRRGCRLVAGIPWGSLDHRRDCGVADCGGMGRDRQPVGAGLSRASGRLNCFSSRLEAPSLPRPAWDSRTRPRDPHESPRRGSLRPCRRGSARRPSGRRRG